MREMFLVGIAEKPQIEEKETEPSMLEQGFLEERVGVGFERLVEQRSVSTSLQRPYVLFEEFPLVSALLLRSQELRLWIYDRYFFHCAQRERESSNFKRVLMALVVFAGSPFFHLNVKQWGDSDWGWAKPEQTWPTRNQLHTREDHWAVDSKIRKNFSF